MAPYVMVGREAVLNQRADGSCVFLDEVGKCRIHTRFGEAAKPFACRIFPFSARAVGDGWRVSFRFDCPSATAARGFRLSRHGPWLTELLSGLERRPPPSADLAEIQLGVRATAAELEALIAGVVKWVGDREIPLYFRLIGAARLTARLREWRLAKIRGKRFTELLGLNFTFLPMEATEVPAAPTVRQRRMLRHLVFAHAEHVTLADLRAGFGRRLGKRWQQLRAARRFHAGKGPVPAIPGVTGRASFEDVERVDASPEEGERIEDLFTRYLLARLHGRSAFGAGYYGWTVIDGLGALWMSVAAAGWLARCVAAADGRSTLSFDDVSLALGIADRAAGRVPALGTVAERIRILYLSRDDGMAALLRRYAPVEERPCP